MAVMLLCGCAGTAAEEKGSAAQETESTSDSRENSTSAEILFEGKDMEGNPVSSDLFSESNITMINVWATYCGPCLSEMPELGELAQEYDAEEFQIIGIVSNVPEERMRRKSILWRS